MPFCSGGSGASRAICISAPQTQTSEIVEDVFRDLETATVENDAIDFLERGVEHRQGVFQRRYGHLFSAHHQYDQIGFAQGHEGALVGEEAAGVQQQDLTGGSSSCTCGSYRVTILLKQFAQMVNYERDTFALVRRGQAQGQTFFGDLTQRQDAVEAIKAGDKGRLALWPGVGQVLEAGPQRDAETCLELVAIVDALVQQVEEIQRQQAHGDAQWNRQQQHQQTFREDAAGVEGGFFDDRNVADLALVQFTVDTGLLKAVGVERIALLTGVQCALQARYFRFQAEGLQAILLQLRQLLVLLIQLNQQPCITGLLVTQDVLQAGKERVRRDALGALNGFFLLFGQVLQVLDFQVQGAHRWRSILERTQHFLTLYLFGVDAVLQVLAVRVARHFLARGHQPGLFGQLLLKLVDTRLGGSNCTGGVVALSGQVIEVQRNISQTLLDVHRAQLIQVALDLLLVVKNVGLGVLDLPFVERIEADTAQCPGALGLVLLDPVAQDLLCHSRVIPGKAQLHHRGACFVSHLEILRQVFGQSLLRRALLHQAGQLQRTLTDTDDALHGAFQAQFEGGQKARISRLIG